MRKNEKQILDEVEKTLGSMDNMPVLNENPFLYSKIKTAIESGDVKENTGTAVDFILKPAFLILILIINIITAVYYFNNGGSATNTDEILINTLRQEYSSSQNENYFL